MLLSSMSVLGVAALGGGLAAGVSLLIAIAVAALVVVGLANAVVVLGQLLDALSD